MDTLLELFQLGMARDIVPPLPQRQWPSGPILNLGAGKKLIPGTYVLDLPEWDADREPIPYKDGTVAGIHAYHFLEHLRDPIGMLREMERVLRPGGIINVCVPYYASQMAAQDLDHKTQWCETTWDNLFRNPYYATKGREQPWTLMVRTNVIMGIVERNIALLTQLQKGS